MRYILSTAFVLMLPAIALAHSAMDRFWGEVPVDMLISGDVLVTRPLIIPKDVTLTIEPGTLVRFEGSESGDNRIIVKGRLVAVGTDISPITFLPKDDRSGPWFGIEFVGEATGRMAHCTIEGSTDGVRYAGPGVELECVEVK